MDWYPCDHELQFPLVRLCKIGDLDRVKAALRRGIDVNVQDEYGWTALMWAVMNNHKVVELLLKEPNIDVNCGWERFALHCAMSMSCKNNNKALKLLLNVSNIDVKRVTSEDQSAVQYLKTTLRG